MYRLLTLTFGSFILGFDAYVISGLLPNISQSLTLSYAQSAQAVTAFTLSYALISPIATTFISSKPAKQILCISLSLFLIGNLLSSLSFGIVTLLISRSIAGLGAGIYAPIAAVTATKLTSKEKKGRALSFILLGMSLGVVLGVPLGLFINQIFNWRILFLIITILSFFTLTNILFTFPKIRVTSPPSLKQRLSILSDKLTALIILVSFLIALSSLGLYTYISPILIDKLGNINIIPYLWSWALGALIGSSMIGKLIDKTKQPSILLLCILALLIISLIETASISHYSLQSFLPFILWGMMSWASVVPQQHILISLKSNYAPMAISLNSSISYLGSATGAILGGLLITYNDTYANLIYWAILTSFLALVIQFFIIIYLQYFKATKIPIHN